MKNALTETQVLLLERWFDGDATGEEAREATALVASSVSAREFHEALKEIRLATEVAEGEAWSKVTPPTAATILASCEAAPVVTLSLSELAPMLERFFDGESDDLESELIAELIDTREDVADYIAGLDELRGGVVASLKELDDRVPMNGFWDSIEARLDDSTSFRADEHALLVQRFHDNSVTEAERAQVLGWKSKQVSESLEALQELNLAVNAAMDEASEGVDFSSVWGAVEAAMDADLESKGENIVALGRVKRDKALGGFSKQSLGAIAALVAAVLIGGIFSQQMFGTQQVIVEKTVVIIDSVEYAAGASVMVNSPFQQASAISSADSETEEPTVIWILDEGDGTLEEPADEAAPANGEEKKEKKPIGQPI